MKLKDLQKQAAEMLEERNRVRDALAKLAHANATTLEEAMNAVAFALVEQRDQLTDLGGEVRMLRDVRATLLEEIGRITDERARLVHDVERLRARVDGMSGQHYLRVLDVVRAAQAWRRGDNSTIDGGDVCTDLADALKAYERGGE